jgi:transposase
MKVGKVIQRYKMSKHFLLEIGDGEFRWRRNEESIAREAALDGVYVLRTNAPAEKLTAPDVVRRYKSLSQVEHLFRTLKSIDLQVRPIRHHREERVRAHILLCMLAYYVEWHMRRALAPLLYEDETLPTDRWQRDPVAPAEAGEAAKSKKAKKTTSSGEPVHSFRTLLQELATCCRNRCRMTSDAGEATFDRLSDPTPLQSEVFELLSCTQ